MFTICLTYYRSLTLANLSAALYSVSRQDFSLVAEVIIVDNNTDDTTKMIEDVIKSYTWSVPTRLLSLKHGDKHKTHSWSTNIAVRAATTSWVLFTRADYLLDFHAVDQFAQAATGENQFIVGRYYDVGIDIEHCEQLGWRQAGPTLLRSYGQEHDHVLIDSGVWMARKDVFEKVGGLDETLSAWGHAQTVFQHRLFLSGVDFVQIPYVLFYHPAHGYEVPRDHGVAKEQLANVGLKISDLWTRYEGLNNPYR